MYYMYFIYSFKHNFAETETNVYIILKKRHLFIETNMPKCNFFRIVIQGFHIRCYSGINQLISYVCLLFFFVVVVVVCLFVGGGGVVFFVVVFFVVVVVCFFVVVFFCFVFCFVFLLLLFLFCCCCFFFFCEVQDLRSACIFIYYQKPSQTFWQVRTVEQDKVEN